ncbi:MAG: ribosome-associated translation inhibitor RaiA [Desulfobacula sp.]|jgi:putative sigma-54 modulation protein|uniref:ribosome hibernation-promoting factor, HPF/YfiA family n=1 Tax=Desulfobacula sp. TaxID=2593537 RepID=UPI001DDC3860|nr:ribosome-associated translation inhibitor RaiA [Desulfobacula sp.]MBT3485348.1 ribosome-associated translation inhibitor RaiA [Desulfobacula sp.]MBT3803800.1 ribosome-associated translation inhibitor RaiA [Desulfobacula sp.]MBT4026634.1 ribosome-associated translation inhibitor RaiA [Desulfobacula sp.]MBT4200545.1 ribosome-associated translation inhibitor RaiA [Desulfobacula sp.]
MEISITFKNIDSSDSLKSHIHKKFDRLDKMLDSPGEAHIVLSVEKLRNIVDINLHCDKIKIHAKEEIENNMYSAIDTLSDNVKLQIRKYKDKQRRHLAGDKQSIKIHPEELDLSDN